MTPSVVSSGTLGDYVGLVDAVTTVSPPLEHIEYQGIQPNMDVETVNPNPRTFRHFLWKKVQTVIEHIVPHATHDWVYL